MIVFYLNADDVVVGDSDRDVLYISLYTTNISCGESTFIW